MAEEERNQKRLAAVVAIDVAGYSSRTEADEARATTEVRTLTATVEAIAKAHHGQVFNTAGDGIMLAFSSSADAIDAALRVAAECDPKVRVGAHVGDVLLQPKGDMLGHAVNVASRIMAKASPGTAIFSEAIQRSARNDATARMQSLGTHKLEKMSETIELFAVPTGADSNRVARKGLFDPSSEHHLVDALKTYDLQHAGVEISYASAQQRKVADRLKDIFNLAGWNVNLNTTALDRYRDEYHEGLEVAAYNEVLLGRVVADLTNSGVTVTKSTRRETTVGPSHPTKWPYVQAKVYLVVGHTPT